MNLRNQDWVNQIACLVSGEISENKDFQTEQQTYLSSLGNQEPGNNTNDIYKNGFSTVVKNKLITLNMINVPS
jgi:hypothetical protein